MFPPILALFTLILFTAHAQEITINAAESANTVLSTTGRVVFGQYPGGLTSNPVVLQHLVVVSINADCSGITPAASPIT